MSILIVDEDTLANPVDDAEPKAKKHVPRLIDMVATQILLLPQLVEDSLASNSDNTTHVVVEDVFIIDGEVIKDSSETKQVYQRIHTIIQQNSGEYFL